MIVSKPKTIRKHDLAGRRFGRLLVCDRAANVVNASGQQVIVWNCVCDCGTRKQIRTNTIIHHGVDSCGCGTAQKLSAVHRTHGLSGTPEHRAWKEMRGRCLNPTYKQFADYGGRGIGVCREWLDSFAAFLAHIGPRPSPRHSLDRIDVNGNYEPGNVRWATRLVQNNNKRTNLQLSVKGETLTVRDASIKYGVNPKTIRKRLARGWPVETAVRL